MADRAPRILLVDDEQPIQTLLSFPLQRDGYEVVQASDGREALARFSEQQFDLVVLDLMLPRMDGLEVCQRLRANGLDGADHHAHGQVGGDRQGARPRARRRRLHHQAVLDARVPLAREGRAAARRDGPARRPTTSSRSRSAACGSTRRSAPSCATATPWRRRSSSSRSCTALARSPGRVFTRDMLLARVWGDSAYRDPRTIDVHIRHLREKIEVDPKEPEYLFTVRGVGYRFRDDEE